MLGIAVLFTMTTLSVLTAIRGHKVALHFKIGWIEIPSFIDSMLCDYLLWFLTWNNILCMCSYNTI